MLEFELDVVWALKNSIYWLEMSAFNGCYDFRTQYNIDEVMSWYIICIYWKVKVFFLFIESENYRYKMHDRRITLFMNKSSVLKLSTKCGHLGALLRIPFTAFENIKEEMPQKMCESWTAFEKLHENKGQKNWGRQSKNSLIGYGNKYLDPLL